MYFFKEFLYIFSFGKWPWQCGQAKDDESFGFGDCQRDCHFRSSLICIIHLFSTVLSLYHYHHYISQQNGHDRHCLSFILEVVHSEGIGNNIFQALRTQAPCRPIAQCAFCQVQWPCGQKLKSKNTLSDGKKIFLRLFFLCCFRKKTLKLVSLFIFRH